MYKGKHISKTTKKFNKKSITMLIALALILTVGLGSTIAYLITKTDPVQNVFKAPDSSIAVVESFDGDVKNNVYITNSSDYSAYIRAAVIVTWRDAVNGNIYGEMPVENQDYTITWTKDGWVKGADGYYYYQAAVDGKNEKDEPGTTGILFTECEPVSGKAPAGYDLHVEILAQAIQAEPIDAVQEAWGVTVTNGLISK